MTYLCFSPENCPTTNRKHYQGYFHLKNGMSMKSATKIFKDYNITVQVCKGTPSQNRIYCGAEDYTKGDKSKLANPLFQEFGELPKQGARTDLNEVKDLIVSGSVRVDELCLDNPSFYHQYGRTLERLQELSLRNKFRTEMTQGVWIFGPTGSGKSHIAFEGYTPTTHYKWEASNAGWWDGYNGQEVVIINDFRGQIPYEELLSLVDKWPKNVNIKYREPFPFTSKKVIITSPLHPEQVYHRRHERDCIEQLLRRFEIIELSNRY